jgi:hypothetical protein
VNLLTRNLRRIWAELSDNPRLLVARIALCSLLVLLYQLQQHGAALVLIGLAFTPWLTRSFAQPQQTVPVDSADKAGDN